MNTGPTTTVALINIQGQSMKRFFSPILTLCFWMLCCPALAGDIYAGQKNDDTVITWGEPHFPPYVITKGENENNGIDDLIKQDVRKHLTGFTHVFRNANYAKILDEIKKQKHMLHRNARNMSITHPFPAIWFYPMGL